MKHTNPSVVFLLLLKITITTFLPIKYSYSQDTKYRSFSKAFADSHFYVSFDVYTKKLKHDSTLWIRHERIILNYNKKESVIFSETYDENERISCSYWLDKEKFIHIDHDAQEITRYENKKVFWDDYHSYGLMEFIPNTFYYLGYYIYPMKNDLRGGLMMYLISDITGQEFINSSCKAYAKFQGTSNNIISYDSNTGKRVIVFEKAVFFVDQETKVLDSVYATQYPTDYGDWKTLVSIRNINYSDKRQYIKDVFNLDKAIYKNYSRHDSKNPPLSRAYTNNNQMTESLLNYSIVKLDGSTTTIAKNDGWILLNFWSINCAPCVAHLKEMGQKKKNMGDYYLESQGVKILAINHRSDNVELIRSIAEKTNTGDIIYYAKGMGGVINIPALGYYYLISPDKQIVYETSDLGDYSELLEAKANYEKQHKNK
jgi:hypothetical protein